MDISAYQHMNIRMSTRGKRPLRNLTPSDKVRAIQRIHNGETKASVSRDIGVPESTLRGWCKNEQKLRFMCRQLGSELPPLGVMENPPEKRIKFEAGHVAPPKFSSATSYEEFAYARLPLLSGMDFTSNGNNNIANGNAILDKITLNEFLKSNHVQQAQANNKTFGSNASQLQGTIDGSQQFAMIQNLNFLSFLNPSLAALSGISADSLDGGNANTSSNKPKGPLRTSSVAAQGVKDDAKNNNSPALVVKTWAKDPSENLTSHNNNITGSSNNNNNKICNNKRTNNNDPNNNAIKARNAITQLVYPETTNFSQVFPAGHLPSLPSVQMSNLTANAENGNAALLEWCKVFNASLNFLALATAAAALQPPTLPATVCTSSDESPSKAGLQHSADNILYKQLTKTRQAFNSPTRVMYMNSDLSNDSYFDSEPEDLSVRSTTSKISSPANSRSQSPAKSTTTSSESAHSDAEQ